MKQTTLLPSVFAKIVETVISQPCYATDLRKISDNSLKLGSAIFIKFLSFHQMIAL